MPRVDKYSSLASTKLRVKGQDIVLPDIGSPVAELARRRLNSLHADPQQLQDLKAAPDTPVFFTQHLKAAARAQGLI
jgi:hypothetical protein